MEKLLGSEDLSYSIVKEISSDWTLREGVRFSWKKVWDLDSILNFNPIVEKYSGGVNGSLIAQFERSYGLINAQPIRVYDYKGNLLYEYKIKTQAGDPFFHMTTSDHLIALASNGYLYTFFAGRNLVSKSLFEGTLIAADIWDNGLVFMTDKCDVFYAPFFENPRLIHSLAPSSGLVLKPTIFKAIPSEYSDTNSPIIFANDGSEYLTIITEADAWKIPFDSPIVTFSFTPNYSMIAFLIQDADDLSLIITNTDPSAGNLLTVILESHEKPFLQLSWVGNDFPIITYEDSVNIIISTGEVIEMETTRYPFSGRSAVFSSIDSALVFSSGSLFKIKNVSDEIAKVSTNQPIFPPAQLVDAFVKRSAGKALKLKAQGKLEDAMKTCLKSSLEVDSPIEQRILMLSANFARIYLNMSDSIDEFEENSKKIRVCNSFQKELNTLISPLHMFEEVTSTDLLQRICNRQRFSLALKVADFLSADKRAIVTEWCCSMAFNVDDDESALKIVKAKLNEGETSFEFNSIASALFNEGRVNLAKQIASLEKSTSRVVPFYISCGMWEDAIDAAVRSSDSTLFIDVINQAIDNNLEDIVTEAVGRDFIAYSTIAKMIGQNAIKNNDFPGKLETYFRIIQKYAENYIPENLVHYVQSLEESTTKYDKILTGMQKPPLNGESFNKVLRRYILDCDPRDHIAISNFVRQMRIDKQRFFLMIGTVLSKNKKWEQFLGLSHEFYADYWHYYVMQANFMWDAEKTQAFIEAIPDQNQRAKLKNQITSQTKDWYNNFMGMKQFKLFPKSLF